MLPLWWSRHCRDFPWLSHSKQRRAMLTFAIWIFGIVASMIVGGEIGLWLFETDIGLIWGVLVGGYAFTFLRFWLTNPGKPPER
jgi:hypothetical protein